MQDLFGACAIIISAAEPTKADMTASVDETHLLIQAFVFVLCVLASALFSGAETALTSMTKIRVKRLFGEGEEAYNKLEPWLHNPNHFLATILVGNNFVNILASVLMANICESILLTWFSASIAFAYGSAVAVAIATFLLLVFGEIVPKTYSKEHAVRISQKAIGPLSFIYRVLRPVIALFLFLSNSIIRLFGGPAIKELATLTEDDIRALIEMSEKEGVLEEEEREMIHSIIDFGDLHVNEIMTPRVDFHAICVDYSWDRVKEEAVKHGHSRIPVYENDLDHIAGILYIKDLLREENSQSSIALRDILRPALIVPETKKVSELLKTFRKEKNHMAIVVDEYGLTTGLVTIEDALEEIVGDIQDEYDEELPEYEIGEDGVIVADAKINLDDLSELLEEEFPEEDVKTLGGFISSISGTVPEIGEEVRYKDFLFVILDSDERRIIRVKIVREASDSKETNSRQEKERNHQANE